MHFKTEILLQNMQIYASLYHKCNFPPSSRVSLQECWEKYFNATSPLPFGHWASAFAKQSASFALATTHSQDVLLNASRPYCSNLRHFSARFNIVRKRGSRHSHR